MDNYRVVCEDGETRDYVPVGYFPDALRLRAYKDHASISTNMDAPTPIFEGPWLGLMSKEDAPGQAHHGIVICRPFRRVGA